MEFFTLNYNLPFEPKYLLLLLPLMILNTVLMVVALVSVIKDNLTQKQKIIWVLVVLLVSTFGPLIYLVYSGIHRKNNDEDDNND